MTRVIVCGGRDFEYAFWLTETLDEFHAKTPISLVIEGGQRTYAMEKGKRVCVGGADYFASVWAMARRVETVRLDARWSELGPKAGPARNQEMIDRFKPEIVFAFPGGAGTADMVRRARAAGIEVREMKLP